MFGESKGVGRMNPDAILWSFCTALWSLSFAVSRYENVKGFDRYVIAGILCSIVATIALIFYILEGD